MREKKVKKKKKWRKVNKKKRVKDDASELRRKKKKNWENGKLISGLGKGKGKRGWTGDWMKKDVWKWKEGF